MIYCGFLYLSHIGSLFFSYHIQFSAFFKKPLWVVSQTISKNNHFLLNLKITFFLSLNFKQTGPERGHIEQIVWPNGIIMFKETACSIMHLTLFPISLRSSSLTSSLPFWNKSSTALHSIAFLPTWKNKKIKIIHCLC